MCVYLNLIWKCVIFVFSTIRKKNSTKELRSTCFYFFLSFFHTFPLKVSWFTSVKYRRCFGCNNLKSRVEYFFSLSHTQTLFALPLFIYLWSKKVKTIYSYVIHFTGCCNVLQSNLAKFFLLSLFLVLKFISSGFLDFK